MENTISDVFKKLEISLAAKEGQAASGEGGVPPVQDLITDALECLKTASEDAVNAYLPVLIPHIASHLQQKNSNPLTMTSLLQLVAEISKFATLREQCTNAGLLGCLLDCLEHDNPAILLQTFRAIGNISCDNNEAREKLLSSGGVEKIIKKLKEIHELESKEDNEKLISTASGLVLNISLDNEPLQREVISFGAIPVLLSFVKNNSNKSDLCYMAVNAIFCLVELDEGRSSFVTSNGCQIFVNILKSSSETNLTGAIGECLMSLAEEGDIQMALVKEDCVNVLQQIISQNSFADSSDSDHKDLNKKSKVAVDIIILLLGDDSCLELLFAEESNVFLDKLLLWNNSNNAYIRNSSPVAIGNIARTESNCLRLVKMDVHKHLVELVKKIQGNTSDKDELQLCVSVLSALKNLAIPASNKAILIESGVLNSTLQFISSQEGGPSPLVYRAITVTRLLIQDQAAAVDKVCSNEPCITKLIYLAQNSGIDALKSEASRLLAVLFKNARTSRSLLTLVRSNALPPVVAMIDSSHAIMQNEALVAIALVVNAVDDDLSTRIDESNLLSNIKKVFEKETPDPQTCYNSMAVIESLFIKGLVSKTKLEDSGILNSLEKLTRLENETVSQRVTSVIEKIKNS